MKDPDRLYKLLPAVYVDEDALRGYPLRAFLRVIAGQVNVVEDDIEQCYENWFIETCQPWAVPYIGDLVGYQPVLEAGEAGAEATAAERALGAVLAPRAEVANTIRYRRRKGTLAILEELARDVAGWPARAAEYDPASATTDLRDRTGLANLGTPFDALSQTIDVRRPGSALSAGHSNVPDVTLFVWRLRAFSVTRTRARRKEDGCYTFSALGNDAPLHTRVVPETDPDHIATEINLPGPIRRRALEECNEEAGGIRAAAAYYGTGRSIVIAAPGWPEPWSPQPIPRASVIPADLSDWRYSPPANCVAIDPELGRIRFSTATDRPAHGVFVSYFYGFSAAMGGGEYPRTVSEPAGSCHYPAANQHELKEALKKWQVKTPHSPGYQHPPGAEPIPLNAVIELTSSAVYAVAFSLALPKGSSLQLRAAPGVRPILRFDENHGSEFLSVKAERGCRLTLDGLLITGAELHVSGPGFIPGDTGCPLEVVIRHCTLVPGLMLDENCHPIAAIKPSLVLKNVDGAVTIEHSIVGTIGVEQDEVKTDPLSITLRDSIVDSASTAAYHYPALCDAAETGDNTDSPPVAHAILTIQRCTVFGCIATHAIRLAENSIFAERVAVARRQIGCMRFCFVPRRSETPRRYRCQPDLALQANAAKGAPADEAAIAAAVAPQFMTKRYGHPNYARLSDTGPQEIAQGGENETEMGAFHDLYQPQRAQNLRTRLEEFTPAGAEAGVIYVT